jgi:glycosyltransferase involved in cell wall biosynthesis
MVVRRTIRFLRSSQTDVVMTNGYSAEIVGRIAARWVGIPVIQWKHNIGHVGRFGMRDRWTEWLLRPLRSRVLAVSHRQVSYLTEYVRIPEERLGCIRNVLEPSFLAGGRSDTVMGEPVVICVAGFRVEKDHLTLLRAFHAVLRSHPDAVLRLVGDGPERPKAQALARELGIEPAVEFLGNRSDVEMLLPRASVFVLASFAVENLPFAVLEAMAAELPVVATDVGALSELVVDGQTGYLVPPRNAEALAAALGRLLASPAQARDMGRAGAEHLLHEFAYDGFLARLEEEVLRCA